MCLDELSDYQVASDANTDRTCNYMCQLNSQLVPHLAQVRIVRQLGSVGWRRETRSKA
jgi:hypothetical protein